MCRLDYLILGREVTIFTDHANIVYLYDPYGRNTGIPKHTASKLTRWAIKLSAFRCVAEHLPREHNVWADMLTRWAVRPKRKVEAAKVLRAKPLMCAPISPETDPKLDWPTINDIKKSHTSSNQVLQNRFGQTEEVFKDGKDIIWIPSDD